MPHAAHPPLRQRATSFVLAVAITFLILLGMLGLNGSVPQRPQFKGGPVLLDLKPDEETADATRSPTPAKAEPVRERPPQPTKPIPVPEVPPIPMPTKSYYIHLTREENDAADIAKHPRAAYSGQGAEQQASAAGTGAGDSRPVGTAPNGQPLYKAEWYRRPTHAELQTYLPPHMPSHGIGVVACRTVANHHVDDCVELGSSPPGSHLAGAVRQAAWQFLVRAPRLGGRELVGAWVSIEIDYSIKPRDETELPDEGSPSAD